MKLLETKIETKKSNDKIIKNESSIMEIDSVN